jgi:hypothetical protein
LNGGPLTNKELVIGVDSPITLLGPGAHQHYTLYRAFGGEMPDVYHVEVEWDDATGERGKYETQFSIL